MEKVTLGSYLRERRETQKKSLADMLKHVKVSRMYLSQIERDERVPSDCVLKQIAKSYSVDEIYIFELANKVPILTQLELSENKHIQRLFATVRLENLDYKKKCRMYAEIEGIFKKYLEN